MLGNGVVPPPSLFYAQFLVTYDCYMPENARSYVVRLGRIFMEQYLPHAYLANTAIQMN